jgi:hypothetical protein
MEGAKGYYSRCVGVAPSTISHGISGLIVLFQDRDTRNLMIARLVMSVLRISTVKQEYMENVVRLGG